MARRRKGKKEGESKGRQGEQTGTVDEGRKMKEGGRERK